MEKINKEVFLSTCDKYKPNKWISFAFFLFSKEKPEKSYDMRITIPLFFVVLFLIGFFGTVFNASRSLILGATVSYSIFLGVFVLYIFSAIIMNNIRLKKIIKELNISKEEYNFLVEKFID